MDGLQDALDEAHYMCALNADHLEATESLPEVSDEDIKRFQERLTSKDPDALSLTSICRESLGFYLFRGFLSDYRQKDLANYFYESALLQTMTAPRSVFEAVRDIVAKYFLDDSPRRHRDDSRRKALSSLARRIPARVDGQALSGDVRINQRSDGGVQFTGRLAENILSLLGVSDRPLGRPFNIDACELQRYFAQLDTEIFAQVEKECFPAFESSPQLRYFYQAHIALREHKTKEDDFEKIRILGRGGFGRVYAVRHTTTGKLFALKIINKKRAKYKNAEKMCLIERETLEKISSPFNMSLKYSFSDESDLYLVLDLMNGGDLGFHLQSTGTFTMQQARYYAARAVAALSVLHRNHFIYRDLKPENILLDSQGRSKLSDFGLTCRVSDKGYVSGACGTRGYWAPEMHVHRIHDGHNPVLQRDPSMLMPPQGGYPTAASTPTGASAAATTATNGSSSSTHDVNAVAEYVQQLQLQHHTQPSGKKTKPLYSYCADWFSLGCCIFEFLVGVSPFRTDKAKQWLEKPTPSGALSKKRLMSSKEAKEAKDRSLDAALQEMEPDFDLLCNIRFEPCEKDDKTDSELEAEREEDLANLKDLLAKLLQKDPINRLGSGGSRYGRNSRGHLEIQSHPWFGSIDWNTLHAAPAPFIPSSHQSNAILGSEIGDFEDEKLINKSIKDVDHSIYKDWYFMSENDAQEEIVEYLISQDSKGQEKPFGRPPQDCCCIS